MDFSLTLLAFGMLSGIFSILIWELFKSLVKRFVYGDKEK